MFNDKHRAAQFLRFCVVGLGNTTVDFFTFFLLTLGGVPYLIAQTISYSAGVMISFFFNRKWTFRVTHKYNVLEAAKFIIVNGLSLLVASSLLFILQDVYHLELWLSKVMATGGGGVLNFTANRLWVFTEYQKTRSELHENQKSSNPRSRLGNKIFAGHKSPAERNAADC